MTNVYTSVDQGNPPQPPMRFQLVTEPADPQRRIDALMKGPSWIFLDDTVIYLERGHAPCTEIRLRLHANGYTPIPVRGKSPKLPAWQKINADRAEIVKWERVHPDDWNTGLLTATTPTLDIDILDEKAVAAVETMVRERYAAHGHVICRVGKAPKVAIPFKTNVPFSKLSAKLYTPDDDLTQRRNKD
jgi:hypothetical protein